MLFIELSNRDTTVVDLSLLWRCDILNVFQWKSKQLDLQQDLRDGNRRSVYKKHWTLVPAAPQTGTCFLTSSANWGSASDNMACRCTNCSRRGKVRKRKWQRVGEKKTESITRKVPENEGCVLSFHWIWDYSKLFKEWFSLGKDLLMSESWELNSEQLPHMSSLLDSLFSPNPPQSPTRTIF